jgi:hemicentin
MRTIILLIILSIDFSNQIDPPVGTSSLAFVFDVTGSMHDDLLQVIQGATHIYNATLRREYSIYDYILIPFADPGKAKKKFFFSLI